MSDNEIKKPSADAPTFDGVRGYTPMPIGGQAVLEGVMMRGKKVWAVAARDEQGEIHVEQHALKSANSQKKYLQWPVIRGIVALGQSLALGTKSLSISARIAGLEEEEEGKDRESAMTTGMIATSVILGIALAVFIFILLPAFITQLVMGDAAQRGIVWNAFDGVMRVLIFFGYVFLISRLADIKRVFRFHGAEHKVIHAVENGDPLTVEAAQKYNTLHTRCGTAFMIMVMALAILVFSLVPVNAIVDAFGITNTFAVLGIRILSRLMLLPLVAGLAYEVTVKWASKNTHLGIVKLIMWPGLQMQRLTTGEPDDDMVEVAIAATRAVLAAEQGMIEPEPEPEIDESGGVSLESGDSELEEVDTPETQDGFKLPHLEPQANPVGA
jgi:uncharacterized protein YqhQ